MPETCEDRDYKCCDADETPADERNTPEWYDAHVASFYKTCLHERRAVEGAEYDIPFVAGQCLNCGDLPAETAR